MQLSKRITTLNAGGSDGWGVFYRARQMKEEGRAVTELTIGEHDVRTDTAILDAMHQSALSGHTGYASVPGVARLREAVAKRVQSRTGVETSARNVIITAGGQAALFASHFAVCNPGDRALFLDPYYTTYPGTIRSAGADPVAVQTRPEDGFQPKPNTLAKAAPGARSLLINSPNNPTGVVYSQSTMDGVAEVCRQNDLWLISDEVYDTQVWTGTHLTPRALEGMKERTLVIGSMSKSHAMTGSRVGWIIGPVEAIDHLTDLATNTTYGVPGFIQDAAYFALAQGAPLEDEVAAPFRRRRALGAELIKAQNHVRMIPPDGAMYMMLDIRATGLGGTEFAYKLLDERSIAVMPGESFGNSAAGHIRVAMTVEDTAFADALASVLDFAGQLAEQQR